MKAPALALSAALLASGCATLSPSECRVTDWRELGAEDGSRGQPANHVAAHQKACAQSGAKPDIAAYEAGRQEGLKLYCTPKGVYNAARAGRPYRGACPSITPELQTALDRGQAYYAIQRDLRDLEAEYYDYPFPLSHAGRGPLLGRSYKRSPLDRLLRDLRVSRRIDRYETELKRLEGPYP
ncbi:MAG: DUF2799 domain-containing protein [Rhodobacteraceae bacterium]|nr:DUF2799 domain-containing protein [Paracoccaceae bacterium]